MLETVILIGAASATVGRLIFKEHGPFGLFDKFRNLFLEGTIAELVRCPICLSTWAAIFFSAVVGVWRGMTTPGVELWFSAYIAAAWFLVCVTCSPAVAWFIGTLGGWFNE